MSRPPRPQELVLDGDERPHHHAAFQAFMSPRAMPPTSNHSFTSTTQFVESLQAAATVEDPGGSDDDSDHRARFMSDSERLLAEHPMEAKASFASLQAVDKKLWELQPMDVITKELATSQQLGLTATQSEARLSQYGPNALDEDPRAPLYIVFLLQLYNMIMALLVIAAVASFLLEKYVEGTAVVLIIILNATITTWQEYSAGNALDALAQMASPQCVVLRDGEHQVIDSKLLVPGDVVVLTTGDVVPADIRLFTSADLKVNEMLLTGESEDVSKKYNANVGKSKKLTADNMVFSSTTVTAGNARGIVVETGMKTRVGSIAALLKSSGSGEQSATKSKNPLANCLEKYQPKQTPLQLGLHRLAFFIGTLALLVSVIVFVVGIARGTKNPKNPDRPIWLSMIMIAVSIAVSAVPEGLPMVVTICLSVGTVAMVKKNVLVRKLAAVETLGAASVICTDKTGTLTEGKMTAIKMWGDFKTYDITGKGFNPEGGIFFNGVNQATPGSANVQVRATLLSCVLCSNTQLKQQDVDGVMTWVPFGNSSEAPLVVAAAKAEIWEDAVSQEYERVTEVPFSSSRKMMITLNKLPPSGMLDTLRFGDKIRYVANVKGAPNYILNNCTRFCQTDGTFVNLTDEHRQQIMNTVDKLSSQALRVLAVAIQPLTDLPYAPDCDDIDEKFAALSQPLVLMGLMASIDPERDGVKAAILTARRASIRTVMITGDYLQTAIAIAKNIDLLEVGANEQEEATDCTTLRPLGDVYLPDHEIDEITSRTNVFARAKPEDKIEIVKSLQRQGLVAAMTGDGVNDAPALKEADIGVAMGVSGTEVAKGASDMVLLDDNFVSIVSAVERGRVIYANIQKFVIFLLSTNVAEIVILFAAVAIGMPMPLEPLQILMLNLFTDGMPGAALSMEKGDPNIMDDAPRKKKAPLLPGRLWKLVVLNAVYIGVGTMIVTVLGFYWNFGTVLLDDILAAGAGATGPSGNDYRGVTCQRWEGPGNGWRTYGNCGATYANGTSVFPGLESFMSYEDDRVVCRGGEYVCMWDGVARAQTLTFLSLCFTEFFRAFTIRSFTASMFVGILANKHLVGAGLLSLVLTLVITTVPVLMDNVFGFAYISWFQWVVALGSALSATFWSEITKWTMRRRDRVRAEKELRDEQYMTLLQEIRVVRKHLEIQQGGY